MVEFVSPYIGSYGYIALFLLFFLGIIGMPLPEETLLVFSGFLVSIGQLAYWPTIAACYFGSIAAMTTAYWIGRGVGFPVIERYGKRFGLGYKLYQRTEQWFKRIGKWILPLGYFLPGVRQYTAYFSGITKLPFLVFILYTYTGGLFWSILFITLGWKLGEKWEELFEIISHNIAIVVIVILTAIILFSYVSRRRRMLQSAKQKVATRKQEESP